MADFFLFLLSLFVLLIILIAVLAIGNAIFRAFRSKEQIDSIKNKPVIDLVRDAYSTMPEDVFTEYENSYIRWLISEDRYFETSNDLILDFILKVSPDRSEREEQVGLSESPVLASKRDYDFEETWVFRFHDDFSKSIKKLDNKIKGRVLSAIQKLCMNPVSTVGDTIKPLKENMKGYWRYRIGDYRLIYLPETEHKQIVLIMFSSRDEAYD